MKVELLLLAQVPNVLAILAPARYGTLYNVPGALEGRYIVKYRDNSTDSTFNSHLKLLSRAESPMHTYSSVFRGFAAKLSNETVETLRAHPEVDFVEPDGLVEAQLGLWDDDYPNFQDPPIANWGLLSISKEQTSYSYAHPAGNETCIFMLDSGIHVSHPEFGGRATQAVNFIPDEPNTDTAGHGTWTAGIVGGEIHGVAKKTKLIGVKVMNKDMIGSTISLISGMNWIIDHEEDYDCPKGVIINISAGQASSDALKAAADRLVDVPHRFLVVAAGNQNIDARAISPANAAGACAVSAMGQDLWIPDYSNFGETVALFAPGTDIESCSNDGGTSRGSGTSASAPFVAGIAALQYSVMGPYPGGGKGMCDYLQSYATAGWLRGKVGLEEEGMSFFEKTGSRNLMACNDFPEYAPPPNPHRPSSFSRHGHTQHHPNPTSTERHIDTRNNTNG
ncbi:peptidase S8/S53 domain-containing protein [Xylariaceae sp. FL0255]|nr:peptidase S8/S53 domain-containing protein [Xylariaceae sp. FL0255]